MNATLRRAGTLFGKRAVLLNMMAGWTVFWAVVVRLNVRLGDMVGAAATGAIAAIPVVGVLLWLEYAGLQKGIGLGWLRQLFSTHETNTPS